MICPCGGLTRSHETKEFYVDTCNACGRRENTPKYDPDGRKYDCQRIVPDLLTANVGTVCQGHSDE